MSTLVQSSLPLPINAMTSRRTPNPNAGILRNPDRPCPSYVPAHAPRAAGTPSGTPNGTPKIRFAPLPDPRRQSDEDETSSSDEDEIPDPPVGSYASSSTWSRKLRKPDTSTMLSVMGMGALFRPSSRESSTSDSSSLNTPNPSPLATSSTTAPVASKARRKSTGSNPSPSLGTIPLRPSLSAEPPKRMLNGRVYGARGHSRSAPPAPVHHEPEFVEWGYGGMGSNRSGERFYNGVQSKSTSVGHHDDYDDGSGMSWVRRRREERMRKEKEEKERAEREEKGAAATTTAPPKIAVHSPDASTHNTSTISVPHRHQSHSRTPSRNNSGSGVSLKDLHIQTDVKKTAVSRSRSASVSSASSRGSTNDDDDEDDADESEEEQRRKTSLCAGVEKVSRHH